MASRRSSGRLRLRQILAAGFVFAVGLTLACEDPMDPGPRPPPPSKPEPAVLGLVEITISGIGGEAPLTAAARNVPPPGGPARASMDLDPVGDGVESGIQIEPISTGSFTAGTRAGGGQRYIYATFAVRNASMNEVAYGTERQNLTFLAVDTDATLGSSAVSVLRRFDGTDADAGIASSVIPTGAVSQASDGAVTSRYPDVLQVLTGADLAALNAPPVGVTALPYGFVTLVPEDLNGRTMPASPAADAFNGLVTFAFRLPLQPTSQEDPYTISVMVLAVDDDEVRITQSIEEQDDEGDAAFLSRADALGATVRTVFWGSSLASSGSVRVLCAATVFQDDPAACGAPPSGVLVVDVAAAGLGDGSSWADAFTTLQDALQSARTTGGVSEIWMAEGVYTPDQGTGLTPGDQDARFDLLDGLTIRGGYHVDLATSGIAYDPAIYVTSLSGDLAGDDAAGFLNMDDNSWRGVVRVLADSSAVLEGVTITGANATHGQGRGGGMRNLGTLTLTNVVVAGNRADGEGAGIRSTGLITLTDVTFENNASGSVGGGLFSSGEATLRDVTFADNEATSGGGLHNAGTATLTDVSFIANTALTGGGMYSNGKAVVTGTTFEENVATRGGGLTVDSASIALVRTRFLRNSSVTGGVPALSFRAHPSVASSGDTLVIVNSVFVGNAAPLNVNSVELSLEDQGLAVISSTTFVNNDSIRATSEDATPEATAGLMVANSIFEDSPPSFSDMGAPFGMVDVFNVIAYEVPPANICPVTTTLSCIELIEEAAPEFVDAASGDYRLLPSSPGIDAGDPAPHEHQLSHSAFHSIYEDWAEGLADDLDGNPRVVGGTIDIGAYEFQGEASELDTEAPAGVLLVDAGATGTATGRTWRNAIPLLQDALALADGGGYSEIRVTAGTYRPDQGAGITPGDRSASFEIPDGVTVRGGYSLADIETTGLERDPETYVTTLSGDLAGDDGADFTGNDENSLHVVVATDAAATAVLDGVRITGGNADGAPPENMGGGIRAAAGTLTLLDVTVVGNRATTGGGVILMQGALTILNSSIVLNDAANAGGISAASGELTMVNSEVSGNTTPGLGGAVVVEGMARVDIANSTIANNSAAGGSALYAFNSDPLRIVNTIVWGHGPLAEAFAGTQVGDLRNVVVEGGCPTGWTCDGILTGDPLFVDAAGGDFRVQALSPAIDAGVNGPFQPDSVAAGITTDRDGNPRIVNGTVDIGAYEVQNP